MIKILKPGEKYGYRLNVQNVVVYLLHHKMNVEILFSLTLDAQIVEVSLKRKLYTKKVKLN